MHDKIQHYVNHLHVRILDDLIRCLNLNKVLKDPKDPFDPLDPSDPSDPDPRLNEIDLGMKTKFEKHLPENIISLTSFSPFCLDLRSWYPYPQSFEDNNGTFN